MSKYCITCDRSDNILTIFKEGKYPTPDNAIIVELDDNDHELELKHNMKLKKYETRRILY